VEHAADAEEKPKIRNSLTLGEALVITCSRAAVNCLARHGAAWWVRSWLVGYADNAVLILVRSLRR